MKTYFVYKTVNKLTNQFYVGVHGGTLEDGYLGSGRLLKRAIGKYGIENFYVESRILCSDADEAYDLEAFIITEDIINHPLCYNLIIGGRGGEHLNQRKPYKKRQGVKKTKEQKMAMAEIKRNMTQETKSKISQSAKVVCRVALTCPSCGFEGFAPNIRRYHFNNCVL
jgi:hypothetical protein